MLERPPEADLLLACARTSFPDGKGEEVEALLRRKIDWDHLLPMARNHGVTSLLFFHLKNFRPDLVPPAVLDRLQNHYLTNAARNIYLTEELLRLLNLFEAHGIPAVPFKGPVLASAIYGDLGLREFSDLDILIRREDLLKAKNLLLSHGYGTHFSLPQAQEACYIQSHTEYFFTHEKTRSLVELQWEVTPRDFIFSLDSKPFWDRLESLPLNGKRVRTFSPKDLIILLCIHGAIHCWERLIWVSDVAELMRSCGGIDGGELIDHAEGMGCVRLLLLGLSLAHELLEAPLPEKIRKKIQEDQGVLSLARRVTDRLMQGKNGAGSIAANSLFYFRIDESWRDRISYCLRLLFTPTVTDWKSLPLPPCLFFLYYFCHPLRMLGKYGRKFLKKGTGRFLSV